MVHSASSDSAGARQGLLTRLAIIAVFRNLFRPQFPKALEATPGALGCRASPRPDLEVAVILGAVWERG